ncbi:MAG: hypothetical protein KY476_21900 [Planctomycetes bacterium]|nr:hypothetical protein [Planctomycetota bacterium]
MRAFCRPPWLLAAPLFILACIVLRADDPVPPTEPTAAPAVNFDGLLVLKSGRTIAGRIRHSSGGYVVEKENGRMLVPEEMVEFPARDLVDARRLYRRRNPHPTAAFHVSLARWCVTNQLFDEAREELREALAIDPHRVEALHMLRRLEEVLDPAPGKPQPPPAQRDEAGFEQPDATSLAGLSRDSAREFTTRIQPLLMNKCANAGCHGSQDDSPFRLQMVKAGFGAHRLHAERNLAAVLEQIDRDQPRRSPLLIASAGNHGKGGRPIFSGSFGSEQRAMLEAWVAMVAGELQVARPTKSKTSDRATAQSLEPAATPSLADDAPSLPGRTPGGNQHSASPEPPRRDPFDPAAFNRGTSRQPAR